MQKVKIIVYLGPDRLYTIRMQLSEFCHNLFSYKKLRADFQDFLSVAWSEPTPAADFREVLWSVFTKKKIELPEDFFTLLSPQDSVEVWTADMRFVFAMGRVMRRTSYSIDELTSYHWSELFSRPQDENDKIMKAVMSALSEGKTSYNVTGWHVVKELQSPYKFEQQILVKMVAPITIGNSLCVIGVTGAKSVANPFKRFRQFLIVMRNRLRD